MTQTADIIILNARVLTLDEDRPRAEAVALAAGHILAVGTEAQMEPFRGAATQVIDAAGGTVLPGFSENHMHLFSGAAELDHLQLAGVSGLAALTEAVRAYAATRSEEKVLFAQGTDYTILGDAERLTRHHLDAILAHQPLVLFAPDHHTAWANTRALELVDMLHGAELGPGNEVVVGADGLATGELREMEAFSPLQAAGGFDRYRLGLSTGGEPDPYPNEAEWAQDIAVMRRGLDYCSRHGITTIQNMDGNLYQLQLLAAIEKQDGSLPCRVIIPFHFKNFMSLDMLEKASELARRFNSDWLSSGVVKVFYDGVLDSWTAVMVEPYADKPGDCGEGLFTPETFREVAVEADRRGLQIAVHAIGDGAVRAVLDGYEAARARNGTRDSRHRIEHIEVVHPDDIARFAELGVIASMQPPHPPGCAGVPLEPTVSRIGRDRWPLSYAWRTLKDAGAHICFASDWPVSPIDPIIGIEAAVTRERWAESDPDQSFSLMEALNAYCVEGAYAEFKEDRKGRIKEGYLADIVVLNGDIEAVAPSELQMIKPTTTICGGRISFSTR
ncbi:hydrolase [Rhizobium sp. Root73]|uniref:amidohydrolase n=1 Tax=unclassified Rhizobium TaxID=2613769 RepID=UPI0007285C9C|nr:MULTISPECIES: amidohydrolase [unclassified Rhizobium]KQY12995.1 hydrolase [Rhizobium sp. Root1334]KRC12461.1 hydrolase [Rhizobium sp. Root73]